MELMIGKNAASKIKERVKQEIAALEKTPHLVVLLNESDESSKGYCISQQKLAEELRIRFTLMKMKACEEDYLKTIQKLNSDQDVDAVLITRPLYKGADEQKIIDALDPKKDIDAMNSLMLGRLVRNEKESLVPATAKAIMELLDEYHVEIEGKRALIIGRSISVGKPVALMLMNRNATVTVAHSKTKNLNQMLKDFDIVVVAIGKPHFIDSSLMNENAVVVDAGIHYLDDQIKGDVIPSDKVKMLSKVPGGVGTITSALAMDNVLKCYRYNHDRK